MIEFAKITGEVENQYIQVKMRTGESLFAPFMLVGTDVSAPSKEWISANKDKFLALVSFEKDIPESPIVVGFYPVKGADSSSYNTSERLLAVVTKLTEQLLTAKVNTMLGPQPFMPDSIQVFNELKTELAEIKKLILEIKI